MTHTASSDGLTLIRWSHVGEDARLQKCVFAEGRQYTPLLLAECLHPRGSCTFLFLEIACLCMLLYYICMVTLAYQCESECCCSIFFHVYVSLLLCQPTLAIITHKKETAYIPWDRCSHIQHTNKITASTESMNTQAVCPLNYILFSCMRLCKNTNWWSWRLSHCRRYLSVYCLACSSQIHH